MAGLSPEDHAALSAWQLGPILGASLPATGTVNRTVLVQTASGAYALRAYRRPDRARIAWEHTAISHAAVRGIPVCRPLPLPGGGGPAGAARGVRGRPDRGGGPVPGAYLTRMQVTDVGEAAWLPLFISPSALFFVRKFLKGWALIIVHSGRIPPERSEEIVKRVPARVSRRFRAGILDRTPSPKQQKAR